MMVKQTVDRQLIGGQTDREVYRQTDTSDVWFAFLHINEVIRTGWTVVIATAAVTHAGEVNKQINNKQQLKSEGD